MQAEAATDHNAPPHVVASGAKRYASVSRHHVAQSPVITADAADHLSKPKSLGVLQALARNEAVPEHIRVIASLRTGTRRTCTARATDGIGTSRLATTPLAWLDALVLGAFEGGTQRRDEAPGYAHDAQLWVEPGEAAHCVEPSAQVA